MGLGASAKKVFARIEGGSKMLRGHFFSVHDFGMGMKLAWVGEAGEGVLGPRDLVPELILP